MGPLAEVNHRASTLNQRPVIQIIADALYQRFERYKIEQHAGRIEFPCHHDRHLIIVPVQRFSLAIAENQEMGGSKVEIIFGDFDPK
jgi:hypothetical protein